MAEFPGVKGSVLLGKNNYESSGRLREGRAPQSQNEISSVLYVNVGRTRRMPGGVGVSVNHLSEKRGWQASCRGSLERPSSHSDEDPGWG